MSCHQLIKKNDLFEIPAIINCSSNDLFTSEIQLESFYPKIFMWKKTDCWPLLKTVITIILY